VSDSFLVGVLLLSPLVGFAINGILYHKKGRFLPGILGTGASALSFLAAVSLFFKLVHLSDAQRSISVTYFTWIEVGRLNIPASFMIDQLSAVMILIVTGVGTLIHLFSVGYMSHDDRPFKFFSYLNFFLFNMLVLVLGENLLVMFVGWEGVGLCSYLLIGFWFTDKEKAKAGMKAFVTNRIGDAGLLLGIFALFANFGTLDFSSISGLVTIVEETWGPIHWACLFLFIGAIGKSAAGWCPRLGWATLFGGQARIRSHRPRGRFGWGRQVIMRTASVTRQPVYWVRPHPDLTSPGVGV